MPTTSPIATTTADRQIEEFGAVHVEPLPGDTPMGATLVPGGATFRVWAPEALEVHIRLARSGDVINAPGDQFQPSDGTRLHRDSDGRHSGFVPDVREGDHYRFYIVQRAQPYKRDPYARELEFYDWPDVDCIVRCPHSYPWHDAEFRTPALRGESINPYYVHNGNRILAFHRWIEGVGRDVVVVMSLRESTFYGYELGFPQAGYWYEVFNSDVYDHWVNPAAAGNGGAIQAHAVPRDGMPASARVVIPANSLLVFTRDQGD